MSAKPEDKNQVRELAELRHYSSREIWQRFWPLVRPHLWRSIFAMVLVALVGLAVALVPIFPKYMIDHAIPGRRLDLALAAAGIFLAVQFARMGIWFAAMIQVYRVQQQIVFTLRSQSFAHLQKLCLRFHSRFPSGFIYERVFGNSINTLGNFMQTIFQQLVVYVSGLLFSLGFCLYFSPLLTLLIVAGAVGYVAVAKARAGRIYQKTRISTEAGMQIVEMIMDKLRGYKTIQTYAIEERVEEEFERQLWPAMRKWMDAVLENMKLGFLTEGLGYLVTAAVILTGGWLVMEEKVQLGTLVAFMGYQGTLIGMIQALTNVFGQFMSARSAFDQLYSVLDTHSTVVEKPGAVLPRPLAGNIEFRNVSFAYEQEPVLRELTASIPFGRTVALVGRSGSGKSTVANLLMRFYDPQEGAILLDGHDLRDLPLIQYRSLFGVVLQDPYLFDATIAANLRYVRPEASDAELIEALKQAQAWEFVEKMPDGLNARVGEGGSLLSGGQRQRLAVARCLLVRSKFVLLDEATSALDVETEMHIQRALESLFRDRTVLVIAHRLSTIRRADLVLVLDQGRLVEQGTYDELLAAGGLFSRLHDIATSTSTHRLKLDEAGFA